MRLEKTDYILRISKWEGSIYTRLLKMFLASLIFYFMDGIGPFIIAFLFFLLGSIIFGTLSSLFNYSYITIDFKLNTIVSTKTLLGFKINQLKLNNVDFDKLQFKEYARSTGGFKKQILKYTDRDKAISVYRLNSIEDREQVEKEIKIMFS